MDNNPTGGSNKTDITIQDALSGAFQALLRGDTDTRDALCALAERTFAENGNNSLPGDTIIKLGDASHGQ